MPTSVNAFNSQFLDIISMVRPTTALDIGCGKGKNFSLIKRGAPNCIIDGIEVESKYIEDYNLRDLYNNLYNIDAKEFFSKNKSNNYDLIVMSDVIEHLLLNDGIGLIDAMLYKTKCLLLIWPTNLPQDNEWDSHYEMHLSNPKLSDFTRFNIVFYKKAYLESRNNVPIDMHIALFLGHSFDPSSNPIILESSQVW